MFPAGIFSAGPAHCHFKSLSHTRAPHKSERKEKFPLSWKQCLSCRRCPRRDRCFSHNDRWIGKTADSIPVSLSESTQTQLAVPQAIIHPPFIQAAPISTSILGTREKHVCKLTEVVYGAQTASSWGSGVPERFVNAVRD